MTLPKIWLDDTRELVATIAAAYGFTLLESRVSQLIDEYERLGASKASHSWGDPIPPSEFGAFWESTPVPDET